MEKELLEKYKKDLETSLNQKGSTESDQRTALISFLKKLAPNLYIGNEMSSNITNNLKKKPDIVITAGKKVIGIIETKKFGLKLNIDDDQSVSYKNFAKKLNCFYILTDFNEFVIYNNNNIDLQVFRVYNQNRQAFNKEFDNSINYENFITIFNKNIDLNVDDVSDYSSFLHHTGSLTKRTIDNVINSNIDSLKFLINNYKNALRLNDKMVLKFLILSLVCALLSKKSKNKGVSLEDIHNIAFLREFHEKAHSSQEIYDLFNIDCFIALINNLDYNAFVFNKDNIQKDLTLKVDEKIITKTASYDTPDVIAKRQIEMLELLLIKELQVEEGFCSQNLKLLDPACGSGIYFEYILDSIKVREEQPIRAKMICEQVCKNLFGFDINPLTWMKTSLRLKEKYPCFNNIYLTDTLERRRISVENSSIDCEINKADDIKKQENFNAFVSNLPLTKNSNDINKNCDNPQKFIDITRKLNKDGKYISSYLLNRSLLHLKSQTEFRKKIYKEFNKIIIIDMQGDKFRDKTINDRNIFEDQNVSIGTCIMFFIKNGTKQHEVYYYGNILGSPEDKLKKLDTEWINFEYKKINVESENFDFLPFQQKQVDDVFEIAEIMNQATNKAIKKAEAYTGDININDIEKYCDYMQKPFSTRKELKSKVKKIHDCDTIAIINEYYDHIRDNNGSVMFPICKSAHHVFLNYNTSEYPLYLNNKLNIQDNIIKMLFDKYKTDFDPKDVFYYIAGRLHSKEYIDKFVYTSARVCVDFPDDFNVFQSLVKDGKRLFEITKFEKLKKTVKIHEGCGKYNVDRFRFKGNKIYINEHQYLYPISVEVKNFSLGSYKPLSSRDNVFVLNKNNKDYFHENNRLNANGIEYLENVANAIVEMKEIRDNKKFQSPKITHDDLFAFVENIEK